MAQRLVGHHDPDRERRDDPLAGERGGDGDAAVDFDVRSDRVHHHVHGGAARGSFGQRCDGRGAQSEQWWLGRDPERLDGHRPHAERCGPALDLLPGGGRERGGDLHLDRGKQRGRCPGNRGVRRRGPDQSPGQFLERDREQCDSRGARGRRFGEQRGPAAPHGRRDLHRRGDVPGRLHGALGARRLRARVRSRQPGGRERHPSRGDDHAEHRQDLGDPAGRPARDGTTTDGDVRHTE